MASCARPHGPYGFSLALNRTTPLALKGSVVALADENLGRTTAAAAPTPSKWANLRRDMVVEFIILISQLKLLRLRLLVS